MNRVFFRWLMKELPMAAAFELIRLEARRTGFTSLAAAADEELQQIYDVVGGNPLGPKADYGAAPFSLVGPRIGSFWCRP
jgi:hypothetical protein